MTAVEPGSDVLNLKGYWRAFVMRSACVVPLELLKETMPQAAAPKKFGQDIETSPPPAEWTRSDFDDSWWPRSRGPFRSVGNRAVLCLRARFTVTDPQKAGMALTAEYTGGLVVYLNGTEVVRRHMPQGRITARTLAAAYPQEAYVDAAGKIIPGARGANRRIGKGEKDLAERIRKRASRVLSPVKLPARLLRRGVNVLAVAVHRSAFRREALDWTKRKRRGAAWPHIGLKSLRLTAGAPATVVPNISRPKGFQVWNANIHKLFGVGEYGDPNELVRPIRLVGVRNGFYSGQVVVGSPAPIEGLKATVTDLKQAGGEGDIPASNVRVRYGALPPPGELQGRYACGKNFTSLAAKPGAKTGAVQPVWVTVNIPRNAPAGNYKGALTLTANAVSQTTVPIELEVIDWALPADPGDYRAFIGICQSPESVAIWYDAPMWSEKHWALIEKSFKLMSYLGNRFLAVPLVTRTQYGNDGSMIPWIKQRDGSYKYDFTAYDRFMKLATRYFKVKVISYQVYLSMGWTTPGPEKPTFVTSVDQATGKSGPMKLAAYNTEESKKQWKPFMAALREHNGKLKIGKDVMITLGNSQDCGVHRDVIAHFKEVWPEAVWHYGAHERTRRRYVKFVEYMYVPASIGPPGAARRHWWDDDRHGRLIVMSQRTPDQWQTPLIIRTMAERSMLLGDKGASRMCIDYWPVKGASGPTFWSQPASLYSRWLASSCGQRTPYIRFLSMPGRDGAVSGIKVEAMREGIQDAEARAFVELALVQKKIAGELADRCRDLLDRRWQFCRIAHLRHNLPPAARYAYGEGWKKRSADLYRLAGEVAKKLGTK